MDQTYRPRRNELESENSSQNATTELTLTNESRLAYFFARSFLWLHTRSRALDLARAGTTTPAAEATEVAEAAGGGVRHAEDHLFCHPVTLHYWRRADDGSYTVRCQFCDGPQRRGGSRAYQASLSITYNQARRPIEVLQQQAGSPQQPVARLPQSPGRPSGPRV